jgi:tRNA nucleotidyltransferase (CCA-adding enzyme)
MEAVLKKILKKITPTESEREEFSDILEKVICTAEEVIKPLGLEKTIAGSFIRDTWLSDKKEVDLFILFPVSYSREHLEKMGLYVGKKIVKMLGGEHEVAYAEHPYVKGKFGKFTIDVVPCYKVRSASKIKSAVDRTPFHNRYIIENLRQKMSKDVRLIKQFCKAMDTYGSDIKTLGFSGYLCELLIIKYNNFKNLINAAKKWKFGTFIDLEGHCKFDCPEEQFRGQPLIVIDPTDPKRNVAASLSYENFTKFVEGCRAFSSRPSVKFFEIDKRPLKRAALEAYAEKRGTKIFIIEFKRPKVVDDILWSQMRKTANRIANILKENEFEIFMQNVWSDEIFSYLVFEMKTWLLPEARKINGPPIYSKRHAGEFIKKYKGNAYIEGERWATEIKRKHRKCDVLLKVFLDKSDKNLVKEGVRSHIAKSISKGFRLMESKDIEKLIGKNEDFAIFLRKFFERKI